MRQIEKEMLQAINGGYDFKKGNTQVVNTENGYLVRLHGNVIYMRNAYINCAVASCCGWNTPTTRSRLRALGVDVKTKNGRLFVNGIECRSDVYVRV